MIESFGFKDCAVILSSVDCMESMNGGIVIQVLGELSNDGAPSQKFAQTFFLASLPPSGYYVLNNIFRYLKEDIDSDYDDLEPDSANEMDASVSHSSEHMTNGCHPASSAVVNEEEHTVSMDLPPSSMPFIASPDTRSESGNVTTVEEKREEHPGDVEETSTSVEPNFAAPSTPLHHEIIPTVEESSPADGRGDVGTQPDERVQSVEQLRTVPAPSSPVTKTWATMAATNTARWAIQNTEQKPATGGTASRTKASGNPSAPRKDVAKPQQGMFSFVLRHVNRK